LAHDGSGSASAEAPPVDVVDTTGAGDAFNAGFLHAWLKGHDLRESLGAGIESGARSVQSVGGAPIKAAH
jgi:sugar/nucleoside kinase (ribokinase family)